MSDLSVNLIDADGKAVPFGYSTDPQSYAKLIDTDMGKIRQIVAEELDKRMIHITGGSERTELPVFTAKQYNELYDLYLAAIQKPPTKMRRFTFTRPFDGVEYAHDGVWFSDTTVSLNARNVSWVKTYESMSQMCAKNSVKLEDIVWIDEEGTDDACLEEQQTLQASSGQAQDSTLQLDPYFFFDSSKPIDRKFARAIGETVHPRPRLEDVQERLPDE